MERILGKKQKAVAVLREMNETVEFQVRHLTFVT